MLERVHLVLVREVEKRGSLTAAAEVLCLTQSALSHAMKKLETQLGTPVWRREGRHLRLTQAGQQVLAVANEVLPRLELAEARLLELASGKRGTLRIGMECHPCYRWLMNVVAPFLAAWPNVEVDVKQKVQFGGFAALAGYEIDLLVTPDPVFKPELRLEPVFDYEQVLAVGAAHPLARAPHVEPAQLKDEVLVTYPVSTDRLDVYTQFLLPAGVTPLAQKSVENTDIMLQLVASGRGVAALPRWLVDEYGPTLGLRSVRLGQAGIFKQIYVGVREADTGIDYVAAFIELARGAERPCRS
ncbi:MAG TPA: LysR family transcriptional regulator [Polyangiaceae bacterium]|nr:LysR family transcriptional regulator [Polyangiaceae bacterium]